MCEDVFVFVCVRVRVNTVCVRSLHGSYCPPTTMILFVPNAAAENCHRAGVKSAIAGLARKAVGDWTGNCNTCPDTAEELLRQDGELCVIVRVRVWVCDCLFERVSAVCKYVCICAYES